jgi:hypothetical protein
VTLRWHPASGQSRLRELVADHVRERVDTAALAEASAAERRLRVREEALRVLREQRVVLSSRDLTRIVSEVSDEVVGLGPIEFLLRDPDVTEGFPSDWARRPAPKLSPASRPTTVTTGNFPNHLCNFLATTGRTGRSPLARLPGSGV